MQQAHRPLGEIMVAHGLLSEDELATAVAEQQQTGKPLGQLIVELGLASPGAVGNALASQHGALFRSEYGVSVPLAEPAQGTPPEERQRSPIRVAPADAAAEPETAENPAREDAEVLQLRDELAAVRQELDEQTRRVELLRGAEQGAARAREELAMLRDELNSRSADVVTLRDELAARTAECEGLRRELEQPREPAGSEAERRWREPDGDRHLLFVPTPSGYRLLERAGAAPNLRDEVEIDDGGSVRRYSVLKRACAPIPNVNALCAYLEALEE